MDPLPDLANLSDEALKEMIDDLQHQEQEISFQRRLLHGRIDILRAELQSRLKEAGPESILAQVDMDRLTAILAGKTAPPDQG
jgi:anti-sigma-K factor RsiG